MLRRNSSRLKKWPFGKSHRNSPKNDVNTVTVQNLAASDPYPEEQEEEDLSEKRMKPVPDVDVISSSIENVSLFMNNSNSTSQVDATSDCPVQGVNNMSSPSQSELVVKNTSCQGLHLDTTVMHDDIQIPTRKEKSPGLFRTLGKKISASFRRSELKSPVISPNGDKHAKKHKKKHHIKHQSSSVRPIEKSVQSSSTSDETSDALLDHRRALSKKHRNVSLSLNLKSTVPSICGSDSYNHDHTLQSSKASAVSIPLVDTSENSGYSINHVVCSHTSGEQALNSVLGSDSSSKVSGRTYSSLRTRDCTLPQCLCVDGTDSSSSNNYDFIGDIVLSELDLRKHGAVSSSSISSTEKGPPGVPTRPDVVPITSSSPTRSPQISTSPGIHISSALSNLLCSAGLTVGSISSSNGMLEFGLQSEHSTEDEGGPSVWSLTAELLKLSRFGWYWGPLSRVEAEEKLSDQPNGAFLVRDSSDDHYLLSLSFRSNERTLHTRIEHLNGMFSFYAQPNIECYSSIVDLIEHSMNDSLTGVFCYSRARTPGSPMFPVRLTKPISRFTQVRSLQYMCRFVIRQYTRLDHIDKLPLPNKIKDWLEENQY